MNLPAELWIGLCLILILAFAFLGRNRSKRGLRKIPAFDQLRRIIDLSVEDGSRLQISLGRGGLLGPEAASAFAGMTLLRQIANVAADSDQPPIATTGDGSLMLLAQDSLQNVYKRLGISEQYYPRLVQTTGLTPMSYAAGALPRILDRGVSASAFVGSFGEEIGLLTAGTQLSGGFSIGGSENLTGQAVLYASADQPLIGEEIFASGAYTEAGPTHRASLRAQDVLRWIVIFLLAVTALFPLYESLP
jgi:hypothetical protein